MLRIGLTGGIGCGKSSVCRIFTGLGVPIIDTDEIAREVVAPGEAALAALTTTFGIAILQQDGTLDRTALRRRVFANAKELHRLEEILHPLIRARVHQRLISLEAPYVVIAIPLLLEKGWQQEVDRILVVDCSEEQQLARTLLRDGGDSKTVHQIIASQISRSDRCAAADDIIHNEGSLSSLVHQVERLHQHYLALQNGY